MVEHEVIWDGDLDIGVGRKWVDVSYLYHQVRFDVDRGVCGCDLCAEGRASRWDANLKLDDCVSL